MVEASAGSSLRCVVALYVLDAGNETIFTRAMIDMYSRAGAVLAHGQFLRITSCGSPQNHSFETHSTGLAPSI